MPQTGSVSGSAFAASGFLLEQQPCAASWSWCAAGAGAVARGLQREHLRVRLALALVPAFADGFLTLRDHAADHGVRPRGVGATLGQAQRTRHAVVVEGGETGFGHASSTRCGGGSVCATRYAGTIDMITTGVPCSDGRSSTCQPSDA
mgnify:CR=1 FL=1